MAIQSAPATPAGLLPVRKVTTGSAAALATSAVIWFLGTQNISIDAPLASLITAIFSFLIAYLVPAADATA